MNYSDIYQEISDLVKRLIEEKCLLEDAEFRLAISKNKLDQIHREYSKQNEIILTMKDDLDIKYNKKISRLSWISKVPVIGMVLLAGIAFVDILLYLKLLCFLVGIFSVNTFLISPFIMIELSEKYAIESIDIEKSVNKISDDEIRRIYDNTGMIANQLIKIKNDIKKLQMNITKIIFDSFQEIKEDNINGYFSIKDKELYDKFNNLIKKLADYERLKEYGIDVRDLDCDKSLYIKDMIFYVYDYNWELMCSEISELVIDNFRKPDRNGYVDDLIVGRVRVKKR